MAKRGGGGRTGGAGAPRRKARSGRPAASAGRAAKDRSAASARPASTGEVDPATGDDGSPRTFRLGAVPGATPGTWISRWRERMPHVTLELLPLTVAGQRTALERGEVDAALVRLPIPSDGLHLIPLYDEVPVVVMAADSVLTTADELDASDLAGEVVIVPLDDVLGSISLPGAVAATFDPPVDTGEAIATVAAGVGVIIVPMSLARLHHRRDVTARPLREGPISSIALAWRADATTPDIDVFVGIVRGRTANSSR